MSRECVTHHHACECREAQFAELLQKVQQLERQNAALRAVGEQLCATLEVEFHSIEAVAIAFGDEGSGHCKQLQAVIEKWKQVASTAIDAAMKEAQ